MTFVAASMLGSALPFDDVLDQEASQPTPPAPSSHGTTVVGIAIGIAAIWLLFRQKK